VEVIENVRGQAAAKLQLLTSEKVSQGACRNLPRKAPGSAVRDKLAADLAALTLSI
jgi:hypothetical protein